MNSDQGRFLTAVVLSGIVLFGWQMFFAPKQVPLNNSSQNITKPADKNITSKVTEVPVKTAASPVMEEISLKNEVYEINGETSSYKITNNLSIMDAKGNLAKRSFTSVAGVQNPIDINIVGDGKPIKLNFNITYDEKNKLYLGKDEAKGINLVLRVAENEKLYFSLKSSTPYRYQVKFNSKKKREGQKKRQFLIFNNDLDRIDVGDIDDEAVDASVKWAGLDYDYHLMALVFSNKIASRQKTYKNEINKENVNGTFKINFTNPLTKFEGYFLFQQKKYDNLVKAGDKLQSSVDFGIFAIIAVPILRGLQFFYKYIPNYGVAIILLTLIIRLLLLPLNYKSFKSMKKMQEVQPEINKLKEKFKDDPQRMQKETMELFKKAGANPLGGCLPLLMQMPIFFAFYRVLYSSVELVGAPFLFWIHDLSIKDPYYVLPVLMTITMFLQQKFMPSATTDPTQKKIMLFMPLVFGVIMKDLPAGLALYIFVSTFVGILQQFFINRSKTEAK